jgi:hypothetical protein
LLFSINLLIYIHSPYTILLDALGGEHHIVWDTSSEDGDDDIDRVSSLDRQISSELDHGMSAAVERGVSTISNESYFVNDKFHIAGGVEGNSNS